VCHLSLLAYTPLFFLDSMTGPASEEGEIDFTYQGEKLRTFYKTFGNVRDRSKRPLILLHGGPGLIHDNLVTHTDLTSKYDIPIILYDQVGNGRSTHLKEKAPELLSIELFVAELENVIEYFGIQDGFDILGHSWGGILASEFEVRKQPIGLKHLILTNSLAAHNLWIESNMQLLQAFPDDVRRDYLAGMKEEERFRGALGKLHAVHGCTVKPTPVEFVRTMDNVHRPNGDPTVVSTP
jgi:proline-specific peptidase